ELVRGSATVRSTGSVLVPVPRELRLSPGHTPGSVAVFIHSRKDRGMIGIGNARGWAGVAFLIAALGLAAGCRGEKPSGNPSTSKPLVTLPVPISPEEVIAKLPGGDEFAAAKKVYATHNCANCHILGDVGKSAKMAMGPAPPPLTNVGAAPEHTK